MADQDQQGKPALSGKSKIAALLLVCAAAVAPFTMRAEGTIYKAYQDPIGKWTICNGHTEGVKPGQTATKEQCIEYLKKDLAIAMTAVVKETPEIVDNPDALKAAGDFTLNSGAGGWKGSPMAKNFANRNWNAGCDSFIGYYASATFKKDMRPKYSCTPRKSQPGKWLCKLPGLVKRRVDESKICHTGIMPAF